jgi:hypothetical protein
MKRFLIAFCLSFSSAAAASGSDGLLLELPCPPGEGDRFQRAGFSFWLADPSRPVRAVIVHQHGCSSAAPEGHPPVTGDWHWRALARKHDAAVVVPMYWVDGSCSDWNDPESGSERALFAALADFARRSGRPELEDAPWLLWGHSGGSSWSAQMIVRHPGRVLAASFRGGCHRQFGDPEFRRRFLEVAGELPLLFVWGARESVPESRHHVSWEPMNTMFRELREQGGRVCRVIDPSSEHGCDDSRLMSIPFFDAVLCGEAEPQAPGMLGDIASHEPRALDEAGRADPALAWLPNAGFARLWSEFSQHGTLRPSGPELAAPDLRAGREDDGGVRLAWRIVPELDGGLRGLRLYRDGKLWRELGAEAGASLATGRDSAPEPLRGDGLVDPEGGDRTYELSFLDAAGNESPRSAAVP